MANAAIAPLEPADPPVKPAISTSRVTIVIPAHNEEGAIGDVIAKLRAQKLPNVVEIVVVDDGSTDRTAEMAEAAAKQGSGANVRVVRHPGNKGYGAALKTGVRATESEYVLTMDADGQHRLDDVLKLCNAVAVENPPDCVIGHRTKVLHSALWRMPGKWLLVAMAQFLTQKKIPDLNSGLRIVRRDVLLKYIHLCPSGFSFSTTITVALLSRGYVVAFEPILVERRIGKSTVSMKTGFQAILLLFRLIALFNPLRIFLPTAMLSILFGIVWTIPYLVDGQGVTIASMLAILTGVLLFALGLICDQVAQLRLERYE
jgi:glycosyltransferase involved in cell wall biosynthesis